MHKDLQNKEYLNWLDFLSHSEVMPNEWIRNYQIVELQDIVYTAYYKTTGYKNLYGECPEIQSLADIKNLPFLTRDMLRDNFESFSIALPERYKTSTGGSSGIPISLYHTSKSFARELASKAHQYHRVGWREGDRQLTMRGLVIDDETHTEYIKDYNELRCSSFHLVPKQMNVYYRKALVFHPAWLRCYPSSGYLFARWLLDNDLRLNLKGVLCASEKLYPFQKQTMSEAFNCHVFSHYGSYELASLAGFCEHSDTYHVLPQYGMVEILNKSGEQVKVGQIGEIVATSFIADATPIIRYKTGDLAIYGGEKCPECGRENTILLDIEGRRWEYIITKSGRKISPAALNNHDDLYKYIWQFRYHQDRQGYITFYFIPKDNFKFSMMDTIFEKVKEKLGDDVVLSIEATKELPLSIRGKHGFLVQELDVCERL